MRRLVHIHPGKTPQRVHYLQEWLDARQMTPMDLLDAINEGNPEPIDKSQVYRWLKGQTPRKPMLLRIAAALSILDPETNEPDYRGLFRHPDQEWFVSRLHGKTRDQIERMKAAVDLVEPPKTGTDN